MNLANGVVNTNYKISNLKTNDFELESFLLSLGCYKGEEITIISKLAGNSIVCLKDARFSLDEKLCNAIEIEDVN